MQGRDFRILEDRFAPLTELNFSDRLILMFALEQLFATGDELLQPWAVSARAESSRVSCRSSFQE